MNKKWVPLVVVMVLGLALFIINRWQGTKEKPTTTDQPRDAATAKINRDRGFDRRVSFLDYSQHATCRMECRKISRAEVEEIMRDGKINYAKSDLNNARCPRYAVEGKTIDNQRVRIVYAQCNEKTTVVTVIDLGTEWSCDCPGDDDKYKNRN